MNTVSMKIRLSYDIQLPKGTPVLNNISRFTFVLYTIYNWMAEPHGYSSLNFCFTVFLLSWGLTTLHPTSKKTVDESGTSNQRRASVPTTSWCLQKLKGRCLHLCGALAPCEVHRNAQFWNKSNTNWSSHFLKSQEESCCPVVQIVNRGLGSSSAQADCASEDQTRNVPEAFSQVVKLATGIRTDCLNHF